MKLIHRHKHQRRRVARIALTEQEIAADLHYPSRPPRADRGAEAKRIGAR